MNFPEPGDYIDIHTHGGKAEKGLFCVENLMAHENLLPHNEPGRTFTLGIHPWYLNEGNVKELLTFVALNAENPLLAALGEAGFDKLRGPSPEIQSIVFSEQAKIADSLSKPLFIHCVRAWDELLAAHKKLRPQSIWIIHGFRGSVELAVQLLSKGFYLSFWFDFAVRPESSNLLATLPSERIFLETDGADIDIREIYKKVSEDRQISIDELKTDIYSNYKDVFKA